MTTTYILNTNNTEYQIFTERVKNKTCVYRYSNEEFNNVEITDTSEIDYHKNLRRNLEFISHQIIESKTTKIED